MSLLARQAAFRDEIIAADDGVEPSSIGMAIYRNAYRGRLLAALEASFERTRRWVGEAAFGAAACHFILAHPPRGWTLDDYGAAFPLVCAELFADDAEVAELAWLEWHLQQAFGAPDLGEIDTGELAEADWAGLRFEMAAGFAARQVASNCGALWAALAEDDAQDLAVTGASGILLVWRAGLVPHWRIAEPDEYAVLARIAGGAAFGEVAAMVEPAVLGAWLAQWLQEGMFAAAT